MQIARRVAIGLASLLLADCGGESSATSVTTLPPVTPLTPRQPVMFTSGRGISDTIDAVIQAPIVVNVVDGNNTPRANVLVGFSIAAPAGSPARPYDATGGSAPTALKTDSSGNVRFMLKLGNYAGRWILRGYDYLTGVEDTLSFQINAGHPVRVSLLPRDTAVYVAASVRFTTTVTDRGRNPTSGSVVYSVDSAPSAASISSDARVTAVAIGRARFSATLSGTTSSDTVRVSVVPLGTIGFGNDGVASYDLAMVNLDGSGYRKLAAASTYAFPSWSPDGSAMVFDVLSLLYRVDTAGAITKLSQLGGYSTETWGRYSPDGQFIYFTSGYSIDSLDTYRMRADGTGPRVRVTPFRSYSTRFWKASPSPDGTQLVYSEAGFALHLMNLASGADKVVKTTFDPESPRFSPDGQWIAYAQSGQPYALFVVHPDGTSDHQISANGMWFDYWGHDWSPDGAWVIGAGPDTLWLIRVSDGLMIPLPYSGGYEYPTWRPR